MTASGYAFPCDELRRIAQEFRHVRGEKAREGEEGSWRRHLGEQLQVLEQRFESLLECWVADPDLRDAWRAHLHSGAQAPTGPALAETPWIIGQSEAGSRVEVLSQSGGGYEIRIEGQLSRRVDKPPGLSTDTGSTYVHVDGQRFAEVFAAGAEAVDALRAFASSGGPPPTRWARELWCDGLIDRHFGITERGRRLLARS